MRASAVIENELLSSDKNIIVAGNAFAGLFVDNSDPLATNVQRASKRSLIMLFGRKISIVFYDS